MLRGDLIAACADLKAALAIAIEIGRPGLLLEGVACFAELLAAKGEAGARGLSVRHGHRRPCPPNESSCWNARWPPFWLPPWPALELGELHIASSSDRHWLASLITLLRGGAWSPGPPVVPRQCGHPQRRIPRPRAGTP